MLHRHRSEGLPGRSLFIAGSRGVECRADGGGSSRVHRRRPRDANAGPAKDKAPSLSRHRLLSLVGTARSPLGSTQDFANREFDSLFYLQVFPVSLCGVWQLQRAMWHSIKQIFFSSTDSMLDFRPSSLYFSLLAGNQGQREVRQGASASKTSLIVPMPAALISSAMPARKLCGVSKSSG